MLVAGLGWIGNGGWVRDIDNITVNTDSVHNLIGLLILNIFSVIYGEIWNINTC